MPAPKLTTPFQDPIVTDFFQTTLNGAILAGAVTATLTAVTNNETPAVQIASEGYAILEPTSTSGKREIVRYNNLSAGAKTIDLVERAITGTDQTHNSGVSVWIVVNGQYLTDVVRALQDPTYGHNHDGVNSNNVFTSLTISRTTYLGTGDLRVNLTIDGNTGLYINNTCFGWPIYISTVNSSTHTLIVDADGHLRMDQSTNSYAHLFDNGRLLLKSPTAEYAYVMLTDSAGNANYLFVDATGDLRIHTLPPITDSDGVVVGTQT